MNVSVNLPMDLCHNQNVRALVYFIEIIQHSSYFCLILRISTTSSGSCFANGVEEDISNVATTTWLIFTQGKRLNRSRGPPRWYLDRLLWWISFFTPRLLKLKRMIGGVLPVHFLALVLHWEMKLPGKQDSVWLNMFSELIIYFAVRRVEHPFFFLKKTLIIRNLNLYVRTNQHHWHRHWPESKKTRTLLIFGISAGFMSFLKEASRKRPGLKTRHCCHRHWLVPTKPGKPQVLSTPASPSPPQMHRRPLLVCWFESRFDIHILTRIHFKGSRIRCRGFTPALNNVFERFLLDAEYEEEFSGPQNDLRWTIKIFSKSSQFYSLTLHKYLWCSSRKWMWSWYWV